MRNIDLDYNLKVRLPIVVFVVIISFTLTYYISKPERDGLGYSPSQPINFPHKLHAGDMKIDCRYCHTNVDKSRHAGVPSADICMNCHSLARKDKPEIIKLTQYYNENKPVPWLRVHKVPEFVYFNHSVHVNKGIDCGHCHGKVQNMEVETQVHSFLMSACLDCHRDPVKNMPEMKNINKGPDYCFACHR